MQNPGYSLEIDSVAQEQICKCCYQLSPEFLTHAASYSCFLAVSSASKERRRRKGDMDRLPLVVLTIMALFLRLVTGTNTVLLEVCSDWQYHVGIGLRNSNSSRGVNKKRLMLNFDWEAKKTYRVQWCLHCCWQMLLQHACACLE